MRTKQVIWASVAALVMVSCAPRHYQLTSVERSRIIIDSRYDQQPDAKAAEYLAPFKRVNDSIMGPVMGQVAHNMHPDRPESDLTNLLSDILVWAAKDYGEQPVFGVYNKGGIRADLTKGDVTYGDILDVAPFENKICPSGEGRASAKAQNWSSPRTANSSRPVFMARRLTPRRNTVSPPSITCWRAMTGCRPSLRARTRWRLLMQKTIPAISS